MKKIYFLTILLILMGCSKEQSVGEVVVEVKEPQNLPPNDFELTLSSLTHNSVTLNWSEAVDPDGDSVRYSIFLNNAIVAENLIALSYEISGLNELTNYSGKIIAKDSNNNQKEKLFSFNTLKYYLKYSKIFEFDNSGGGYVASMIKTRGNNYVILGAQPRADHNAQQPIVLKIDLEGNKIWQKSYDFVIGGHTRPKFIQTSDDGFIFAVRRYVFKTDIDGNLIWQREIQSYNTGEDSAQIQSVKEDSEGFLYVVGGRGSIIDPQKTQEAVLTKLDSQGTILWEKIYGTSVRSFFNDLVITPSNDVIILGSTETSGLTIDDLITGNKPEKIDFWLVKTNLNGDLDFEKTIDGGGYAFPEQIIKTMDGNFTFVGYSWGAYDISGARLFKIDTQGNEIWSSYHNSGSLSIFSVDETSDGGFVSAGYNHGDTSNWLVILNYDNLGNVVWEKSYYKFQRESVGYSILQTDDQGYLITSKIAQGVLDGIWVIKTDPDGNYE